METKDKGRMSLFGRRTMAMLTNVWPVSDFPVIILVAQYKHSDSLMSIGRIWEGERLGARILNHYGY